jgi:hypothetical protein
VLIGTARWATFYAFNCLSAELAQKVSL